MDAASYIAIYLPIFILLFIVIMDIKVSNRVSLKNSRKRLCKKYACAEGELYKMNNEIITALIGKTCTITTGNSFAGTIIGKITKVADNWIEVETKKCTELVNMDYVIDVKVKQ